jgi:GntR family transcriptional regulator
MEIEIDIDSAVPLFTQLVEQVKAGVKTGGIEPGASLPSIRQLARDLNINNKTVAKAYRHLERDQIIEAKGYRGTFVHPNALRHCEADIPGAVEERLVDTVRALKDLGATDSEIRIAFANVMNGRHS